MQPILWFLVAIANIYFAARPDNPDRLLCILAAIISTVLFVLAIPRKPLDNDSEVR